MHEPEKAIARLLTTFLGLAALLATVGGVWMLAEEGGRQVSFRSFAPPDPILARPAAVAAAAFSGRPAALVQLAVVVLLVTPLARELVLVGLMARRREWLYLTLGLIVCVILGSGLLAWGEP